MRAIHEYRRIARMSLSDKWGKAISATMIVSFLGVSMAFVNGMVTVNYDNRSVSPLEKLINHPAWANYARFFAFISMLGFIIVVINFIIGGAINLGYASFNKRIVDGEDVEVSDIFSQMRRLVDGFVCRLLTDIYIILWMFVFIIPGIVKSFSYALTPYIMNDYPELGANAAITMSRKVMDGKKGQLFGLYFSFILWAFLANSPSIILAMIANSSSYDFLSNPLTFYAVLILTIVQWAAGCMLGAYAKAAEAAFYKDAIEEYTRMNSGYYEGMGTGGAYTGNYGQDNYDRIQQYGNTGYDGDSNFSGYPGNSNTGYPSNSNTGYPSNSNAGGYNYGTGSGNNSGSGTGGYSYGGGSGNNSGSGMSGYSYGDGSGNINSSGQNSGGDSTVDNPFEPK